MPRHKLKKLYIKKNIFKKKILISRPFLFFSRFIFLKFCEFWGLPVYPDLTNLKINLKRNHLRLQVLPYIKFFFNKNLSFKIKQIQKIINFENQYFQKFTRKIYFSFFLISLYKVNFLIPQKKIKKFINKFFFYFIKLKTKFLFFTNISRVTYQSILYTKNFKKYIYIEEKKITNDWILLVTIFTRKKIRKKKKILLNHRWYMSSQKDNQFLGKLKKKEILKKNAYKKINKSLIQQKCCFRFKNIKFIQKYFQEKYFNNSFDRSFTNIFLYSKIFQKNYNSKFVLKYNFKNLKYFPKTIKYRFFYYIYNTLLKKITFNEIFCIFNKINIEE